MPDISVFLPARQCSNAVGLNNHDGRVRKQTATLKQCTVRSHVSLLELGPWSAGYSITQSRQSGLFKSASCSEKKARYGVRRMSTVLACYGNSLAPLD